MRHNRRCFGRLEQQDQRLKKHYNRWMDIVRSLELESFILTKLTKHSVPVNLLGPQVSHPPTTPSTSWMDIARSLQLESFILTKLTKPLVRVNLVGP